MYSNWVHIFAVSLLLSIPLWIWCSFIAYTDSYHTSQTQNYFLYFVKCLSQWRVSVINIGWSYVLCHILILVKWIFYLEHLQSKIWAQCIVGFIIDQYEPKLNSPNNISCRYPVTNFVKIHILVSKKEHVMFGHTISPLCIHFMCLQRSLIRKFCPKQRNV